MQESDDVNALIEIRTKFWERSFEKEIFEDTDNVIPHLRVFLYHEEMICFFPRLVFFIV